MIRAATVAGDFCARDAQEVDSLILYAVSGRWPDDDGGAFLVGHTCHLKISERGQNCTDYVRDHQLTVSVNPATGYGALMWCVTDRVANERGGMYEHVWVSGNPDPPDFDPEVPADWGDAVLFDPGSAIPLPSVRAALEEFCGDGSGDRPRSVEWVPGDLRGRRSDRHYEEPAIVYVDYAHPWP